MICKRILPCIALRCFIREYVVAQFSFEDTTKLPPLRVYPANPDEAIRFLITGKLLINHSGTNTTIEAPAILIVHLHFDDQAVAPTKAYTVNPEEGIH